MLALLTAEPMTGYDVAQHFDEAVAQLWAAPHSQIFPELRKMEDEGLVRGEDLPRGEKATKRVYTLTAEGREALARWLVELEPSPPETQRAPAQDGLLRDDVLRLRPPPAPRPPQLLLAAVGPVAQLRDMISARTHPLLRLRLSTRPESEHEAIVAFKRLAFEGMIARPRPRSPGPNGD